MGTATREFVRRFARSFSRVISSAECRRSFATVLSTAPPSIARGTTPRGRGPFPPSGRRRRPSARSAGGTCRRGYSPPGRRFHPPPIRPGCNPQLVCDRLRLRTPEQTGDSESMAISSFSHQPFLWRMPARREAPSGVAARFQRTSRIHFWRPLRASCLRSDRNWTRSRRAFRLPSLWGRRRRRRG